MTICVCWSGGGDLLVPQRQFPLIQKAPLEAGDVLTQWQGTCLVMCKALDLTHSVCIHTHAHTEEILGARRVPRFLVSEVTVSGGAFMLTPVTEPRVYGLELLCGFFFLPPCFFPLHPLTLDKREEEKVK